MKAKNIIIMALAGILLTACKDKTYKPPTLDAMRSADKARATWAREAEENILRPWKHKQAGWIQLQRIVYQPFMAKKAIIPLIKRMTTNHPVWEKIINHPKKQNNKRIWYYM